MSHGLLGDVSVKALAIRRVPSPIRAFQGRQAASVDARGIPLHPLANLLLQSKTLLADPSGGIGTEIEREIAGLAHAIDQGVDEISGALVRAIRRTVPPGVVVGVPEFPRQNLACGVARGFMRQIQFAGVKVARPRRRLGQLDAAGFGVAQAIVHKNLRAAASGSS